MGAGQRDGPAQLLAGALELVRPHRRLPQHGVHERLAGAIVRAAGVPGGLGQQRVRGLQRGFEVTLQPGLREAGKGPRLQVPAAPRLGHRHLLGVLQVALGGLGVADVERRARERRGQFGVLLEPVRWELAQQRTDSGGVAAHVQVEPVVGDDLHRQVPLARLHRVPERVDRGAARGVPAGGARVQVRKLRRQLPFGARAQQLGEQAVVAEPLAMTVHTEDEPIGALQGGERVRAVAVAGQRVGEAAAHAVDQRRAQEERAQPWRLAIEHLGDEVVGDHAIVAGELGHELVRVLAALETQRREPQAGAPTLRPRVERLDQLLVEGQAVRLEQLMRLALREREVGRADLGEPAAHPQHVQRQRRVAAGGEHQSQRVRCVQQQEGELRQAFLVAQHVDVVEHQHHAFRERGQGVDEQRHERVARLAHRRGQRGDGAVARDGAGEVERGEHRVPEMAGLIVGGLERDPRRGVRPALHLRRDQRGLAAPGGRAHERDRLVHGQPQALAVDHPERSGWDGELGHQRRGASRGGRQPPPPGPV